MTYEVGLIVEHPKKPEWGPGKVVVVRGDKVHVVFRDVSDREAKVIGTNYVQLSRAAVQSDPILDNLPPLQEESGKWVLPRERVTVEQALQKFTRYFPQGFRDPAYLGNRKTGERNYKWWAHEHYLEVLGGGQARALLNTGDVEELAGRAESVIGKVNLLSPYESAAFRDAMAQRAPAKRFFEALLALLEADTISRAVFDPYADAVCDLPQRDGGSRVATWPVATVLPFLAKPSCHLFLKPSVTQRAAETLGFDLCYDPTPNWGTYGALLRMGEVCRELIAHLKPLDMIDVQSFLWVTSGGYDD